MSLLSRCRTNMLKPLSCIKPVRYSLQKVAAIHQARSFSNKACISALTSNHARGTAFEHLSIKVLSELPIDLSITHRGGAGDQGVDFIGTLHLKQLTDNNSLPSFPVIGQCKYEQKAMGPIHLRGLEGSLSNFQSKSADGTASDAPLLGFMVSAQPFSTQTVSQWKRSPCPIILVVVDPTFQMTDDTAKLDVTTINPNLRGVKSSTLALRRFSLNPVAQRLLPSIKVDRFHDSTGVLRIVPHETT